jgi:hypothetical protein
MTQGDLIWRSVPDGGSDPVRLSNPLQQVI